MLSRGLLQEADCIASIDAVRMNGQKPWQVFPPANVRRAV